MAIEEVKDVFSVTARESGYRLNDRLWTRSSDVVYWHEGVIYCHARGSKIQTLDDAVEFRNESNGQDKSNLHQLTGTLVAVGNDGKAGLRAYVWEPSAEELLALANSGDMRDKHYVNVAKESKIGREVLKTDRTFIVPRSDPSLSVETDEQENSPYSKDEEVLALMPNNAKLNAENIARAGYKIGWIGYYRTSLADGQLRIRPFGLGGGDYIGISSVFASSFSSDGRARGLAYVGAKISSGDKGRRMAKSRK